MAANNNSIVQEIHQKPSAGANQRILGPDQILAPAKSSQPEALRGARDAVWVASVAMNLAEVSVAPILVAIEALAHINGMAGENLVKRLDAIQRLARVGVDAVGDMVNTLDCEREDMQDKLNALEGALS